VARSIGCEVTKWQGRHEDHWKLSLDFLRANIRSNTKAIVINTPHNPTGYLMSPEDFKEVIQIAKQHNLYVFCDEVYRLLEHDPKDRLPSGVDLGYDNVVALGVMSKALGLPGLRVGWVVTKNK
jgi:aspartate/methionine/tyrosine aminotransferase